ncbi:uncharacterized protein LOC125467014 isoform X2 [Stegostoma tigrinum]|uniref:uncharacterized protein LOC125467014 isoform X2 n=1 Tax=Stegostoma tigrinum TaxID=3053191 RepID=UPI00202B470C|nr:uncharacterized protein LOC125467014 isoform X2 [Stegostoma tigrinum]
MHVVGLYSQAAACDSNWAAAAETRKCDPIQARAGDSVKLPCKYTPRSRQNDYLDIEWALRSANVNGSDKVILTLSGGQVYVTPGWQQRIAFISSNCTEGDASLCFKGLAVNDSGIYNCKVKVGGEIYQTACNLTVRDNTKTAETTSVPPRNQETQQSVTGQKTVQQNTTNASENSTSATKDPSAKNYFYVMCVGIGFGIPGFIILVTYLKCKPNATCVHSSMADVSTVQQSEDFSSQGNVQQNLLRVSDEDTIYSIVQPTSKNTVKFTAQAQDQDIVYSKIQILNARQNCNENIISAPVQNIETASQLDTVMQQNPDVVYAKIIKNDNVASV